MEIEATGSPFEAATDGPAYRAMAAAMQEAYGRPMAHLGQGGSIPLCNVFEETYPDAELILMGVEEPLALIHAPNESVDPTEIASMALAEALFLQRYAPDRAGAGVGVVIGRRASLSVGRPSRAWTWRCGSARSCCRPAPVRPT